MKPIKSIAISMRVLCAMVFIVLFLMPCVSAHQPRIVSNVDLTDIMSPEISQAFYGNLTGKPAIFKLNHQGTFNLFLQILLPDLPSPDFKTFAVITHNNSTIGVIDGSSYNWTFWHEEFANDDYWSGPNISINANGDYTVIITNSNNMGKYVLVVGEKEYFTPEDMLNSLILMPQLKEYMGKSPTQAYNNRIGAYYYGSIVLIALLLSMIILSMQRRKTKN